MTSPFSDELISAYLDGELTAQEQVYVEEQLREHADLRRMCDELRAAARTLQAMPVAEPPENLAERILRQAERRMLSDEAALVDSSCADPAEAPSPAGRSRYALRDWRVGVAVVATLAACVLAMLWLPQMSQQARDVAQAPNTAAPSSPVERRVEIVAAPVRDAAKSVVPGVDFAIQDGASRTSAEPGATPDRAELSRFAAPRVPSDPAPAAAPEWDSPQALKEQELGAFRSRGAAMGDKQARELAEPAPSISDAAPQEVPVRSDSTDAYGGSAGGMGGGGRADYAGAGYPGGAAGNLGSSASPAMPGAAAMMGRPSGGLVRPLDAGTVLQHNLSLLSQGLGTGAPVTVQRIDQLVSDLDETPFLLVKVQLPQSELPDSLDVLIRSKSVDRPTDQQAGKALETEMYMLQSDLALCATVVPERVAQEPGETGSGSSQKVFVVNGSADQIRQTLTALVARPGVAVETTSAESRDFAYRWFGSTGDANLNPLGGADAKRKAGEAVPEIVSEEKLAQTDAVSPAVPPESCARRSEDAAAPAAAAAVPELAAEDKLAESERQESAEKSKAGLADGVSGPVGVAKDERLKEVAENQTIIYILFRLGSAAVPPAPADNSTNR